MSIIIVLVLGIKGFKAYVIEFKSFKNERMSLLYSIIPISRALWTASSLLRTPNFV